MITTTLPKGIPDGYRPELMKVKKPTVCVLVSEDTRRAAHELDDMHRAWIVRRREAEPESLDDSPFANDVTPIDHLEWLTDKERIKGRYAAVVERRQWLENMLGQMRLSHKARGRVLSQGEFVSRFEALKFEWTYISALQTRMRAILTIKPGTRVPKEMSGKEHSVARTEKLAVVRERLREDRTTDFTMILLIDLEESLREWLKEMGNADVPKRLQSAIDCATEAIRAHGKIDQQEPNQ